MTTLQSQSVPLPIAIFLILTVLVPIELGFQVGTLLFTWSKAYLFVVSPFVLLLTFTQVPLRAFDIALIAHTAWAFLAYLISFGPRDGVEAGGAYVIEFLSVYCLVRLCLREPAQLVAPNRCHPDWLAIAKRIPPHPVYQAQILLLST